MPDKPLPRDSRVLSDIRDEAKRFIEAWASFEQAVAALRGAIAETPPDMLAAIERVPHMDALMSRVQLEWAKAAYTGLLEEYIDGAALARAKGSAASIRADLAQVAGLLSGAGDAWLPDLVTEVAELLNTGRYPGAIILPAVRRLYREATATLEEVTAAGQAPPERLPGGWGAEGAEADLAYNLRDKNHATPARLVEFMTGKRKASAADVGEAVKGDAGTNIKTIRSWCTRASATAVATASPFRYRLVGEVVIKTKDGVDGG